MGKKNKKHVKVNLDKIETVPAETATTETATTETATTETATTETATTETVTVSALLDNSRASIKLFKTFDIQTAKSLIKKVYKESTVYEFTTVLLSLFFTYIVSKYFDDVKPNEKKVLDTSSWLIWNEFLHVVSIGSKPNETGSKKMFPYIAERELQLSEKPYKATIYKVLLETRVKPFHVKNEIYCSYDNTRFIVHNKNSFQSLGEMKNFVRETVKETKKLDDNIGK
jgi:hypothetical protein